MTVVYSLFGRW